MDKYIVFVASVLKGSTFIERKNLNSAHKLFDSPEEAIAAIQDEIKRVYCIVYGGGFQCRLVAYKSPIFLESTSTLFIWTKSNSHLNKTIVLRLELRVRTIINN